MKRSIKIVLMVIAIIFIILYAARDTTPTVPPESPSPTVSKEELQNLKKYQERFARNSYHLKKALSSINELKSTTDTLNKKLYGNAAINLKILHHRSIVHLEEIIKSVKTYEEYPNRTTLGILENAIAQLQDIDDEIIGDSLKHEDIYQTFKYTLNALAKAEINISESAFKTNQIELAQLSLKQAQLHIKNAFLLDYSLKYNEGKYFDIEVEVFQELDSLIENEAVSLSELDKRLAEISSELDMLLEGKY